VISDVQLFAPLGQWSSPPLFPALGQQGCAHPAQVEAIGHRLAHIDAAWGGALEAAVQQVGAEQHGAAGPAQLHHVDGAHGSLACRCGRAAAHHMPEVVGVAHALVQPGVVAIAAALQHRIGQRLASGIGHRRGIAAGEQIEAMAQVVRFRGQGREIGGQVQQLAAQSSLYLNSLTKGALLRLGASE